jgi:hypothetical protein
MFIKRETNGCGCIPSYHTLTFVFFSSLDMQVFQAETGKEITSSVFASVDR